MLLEVQPGLIVQERANESSSSSVRREQGNCFLDGRASSHSCFPFRARCCLLCEWDGKKVCRASAWTTFNPHPPSLTFDDLGGNIEAKPKSRKRRVLRVAHSKKAFKEMFLFLRGDANTKILHADGGVFLRSKRHQDGLGLGRIFYRVGEHIGEHLTNTLRVPEDQGGKGSLDVYLMLLRCLPSVLDTLSHQGIQVKHIGAPVEFPCLNGGDIQQFIDQGDEFIYA